MAKHISTEELIALYNRLTLPSPRDPIRRSIIAEAAQFYDISVATVYRELHKQSRLNTKHRSDYNLPRVISQEKMRHYCELIAALKLRTTNKKNHHLSTKACIKILEENGIQTPDGLIKVTPGLLKKSTISLYLKRFGLDQPSLGIQPTVIHFQADKSNECWQFDFSPSDFKHFSADQLKDTTKLMLLSVIDDRSLFDPLNSLERFYLSQYGPCVTEAATSRHLVNI